MQVDFSSLLFSSCPWDLLFQWQPTFLVGMPQISLVPSPRTALIPFPARSVLCFLFFVPSAALLSDACHICCPAVSLLPNLPCATQKLAMPLVACRPHVVHLCSIQWGLSYVFQVLQLRKQVGLGIAWNHTTRQWLIQDINRTTHFIVILCSVLWVFLLCRPNLMGEIILITP